MHTPIVEVIRIKECTTLAKEKDVIQRTKRVRCNCQGCKED